MIRKLWRKYLSRTPIANKLRYERDKIVEKAVGEIRKVVMNAKFGDVFINLDTLEQMVKEMKKEGFGDICINDIYLKSIEEEYEREK